MNHVINTGFDSIAQMLFEQKKLMDALEAENRKLRLQLADLQRGIGIAVVIEGKIIQLQNDLGNTSSHVNAQASAALQSLHGLQNTPSPLQTSTHHTAVIPALRPGNTGQVAMAFNDTKHDNIFYKDLADSFIL
jgi:hypothetical protein